MTPFHRILTIGILSACLIWIGIEEVIHPAPASTMGWVFLALVGNFLLMLVPIFFYRPSYGWFHPLVFGIFLTLIVHLRRVDTYIDGLQWHTVLGGWDADNLTLLVAYELALRAIGLIGCYAGFFLIPTLGVPKMQFGQPRNIGFKMLLVVLFSAGVFAAFIQSRGGLSSHILSWGEGRSTALEGTSYWLTAIQFGVNACLVWLVLERNSTRQPLFWGCTALSLVMAFLSGGSRTAVIYPMVMGLLVWLMRERKIALGKILLFVLTGILLTGLLGNFRASTFGGRIDWDTLTGAAPAATTTDDSALTTGLMEITERGSVTAAVFPILALVPREVDFIHGSSYLALVTLPIPRAIWPEKPGMVDGRVGAAFYGAPFGIPPGPIGEAYWNFGIPGVFLVFFVLGAFYRWLSEWFQQHAQEPTAAVLYILTLFQLSEPSSSAILNWLLGLVPFLIILRLIGAFTFKAGKQERSQTA